MNRGVLRAWILALSFVGCATAVQDEVGGAGGSGSEAAGGGGTDAAGGEGTGAAGGLGTGGAGGSTTNNTGGCNGDCGGEGGSGHRGPRVPEPGEVIFTELFVNAQSPITDDGGEWLELLNVSGVDLELAGCTLRDAGVNGDNHVIAAGSIVIGPGEVLVFAKTADASTNGGLSNVAYAFGSAYALTNTGDTAELACDGLVIDSVAYTDNFPYAEGVSMQLSQTALTAANNDALSSWCAATASYGTGQLGTPGSVSGQCQ